MMTCLSTASFTAFPLCTLVVLLSVATQKLITTNSHRMQDKRSTPHSFEFELIYMAHEGPDNNRLFPFWIP